MNVIVREYQSDDRSIIEHMILDAENYGVDFLDHEKLRIDVFTAFPTFGRILVAYDSESENVVGYIAIQFDWKALVINSIITHHEHLRKGIGKKMVEKVKEIGETHLIVDMIRVDTGDFMDYAQQFYLSCGFERAGNVPHYLSWNNHQVVFVYQLRKT
ncbi:MAG: GNAT family N-acetyltransferase [Candidatus Thorarchaeota archaeon]|jgi:ribosomal protein S18 acetylase RimI-like enzyme